jgi:hypothetical protein
MAATANVVVVASAAIAFLLLSSTECSAYPWKCTAFSNMPPKGPKPPPQTAIASSKALASKEALAACYHLGPTNCWISVCRDMHEVQRTLPR